MNINFKRRFDTFKKKNKITLDEIFSRTGIAASSMSVLLSDENKSISLPVLCRLVSSFRDQGSVEAIFCDEPQIVLSIFPKTDNNFVFSDIDLSFFTQLFWNNMLMSKRSADALFSIYYVLINSSTILNHLNKGTGDEQIENRNKRTVDSFYTRIPEVSNLRINENLRSQPDRSALLLRSFISSLRIDTDIGYRTETTYPHQSRLFSVKYLQNGESFTWTDIAAFVSEVRAHKEISVGKLDELAGIAHGTCAKLEYQTNISYQADDIMKLDNALSANGLFFSMCFNATRNTLISLKIMENRDKKDAAYFFRSEMAFIRLLRNLENEEECCNFYKDFLTDFRALVDNDEDTERKSEFLKNIDENKMFIADTDALRFYFLS